MLHMFHFCSVFHLFLLALLLSCFSFCVISAFQLQSAIFCCCCCLIFIYMLLFSIVEHGWIGKTSKSRLTFAYTSEPHNISLHIYNTRSRNTHAKRKKTVEQLNSLHVCVCVSGTYKKETTYCVPPKKISFVIHNFTFFPIFSDNVWFLFLNNNNNNKECIGIQSRLKETARE